MNSRRFIGLPKTKDHDLTIAGHTVHRSESDPLMSESGQSEKSRQLDDTAGLPSTADISGDCRTAVGCQQRSSALARSATLVGSAECPQFRGRDVMERLWQPASFRLDVGGSDHLGPLLGFVGDELAEVGGRACERIAT
jgi:hypothetical protein